MEMGKKCISIVVLVFFIFFTNLLSQVTEEWSSFYNSPENNEDISNYIFVDNSGNSYVTGQSKITSNGYNIRTIKYSPSGIELWNVEYNSPQNDDDIGNSIAVDVQGNVYVGGSSGSKLLVIKYNSSGVEQWVRNYGALALESRNLVIDSQGNVYISGTTGDVIDYHYTIVKYNSQGIEQWDAVYNENGITGYAASLAIDPFDNLYITGQGNGIGPASNCITVKYNSSGIKQWTATYNGPSNLHDWGYSIIADSQYVYVAGTSLGSTTSGDFIVLKYNVGGVEQWVSRYNRLDNSNERGLSIAKDVYGNVFATGQCTTSTVDYLTVKYNSSGQLQWGLLYDGTGSGVDIPKCIKTDEFGRSYVIGTSKGSTTGNDIVIVKYSPTGQEEWVSRYTGAGNANDGAGFMQLDNDGNIFVSGFSAITNNGLDYVTIKLSQITHINTYNNTIPNKLRLENNFPNPFNPSTTIRFELPAVSFINLSIFDVSGRKVSNLVNKEMNAGIYEVNWNGSEYSSGVYFYTLETEDFSETKKMLLAK